jgi:antitoxin CptB
MGEEDNDLVKWIIGEQPVPACYQTQMFQRIAAYRPDFDKLPEGMK